jgi:hypothetical protein
MPDGIKPNAPGNQTMLPTTVKLGKRAPRLDSRTLKLSQYLPVSLPPPPTMRDWSNGSTSFGMMLNDQLGCCTIAACGHAVQVWTANTTSMMTELDETVLKYYELWDGYDPRDPGTDQGGVELDVLNCWRKETFNRHRLVAYAEVPHHDLEHVKQAICLFGGLYVGISLPRSAAKQAIWDAVDNVHGGSPGSWGGHAVYVVGYDAQMVTCITWGVLQKMTWNFWLKYIDEAYALLGGDFLPHFGGGTINMASLLADLKAVTS